MSELTREQIEIMHRNFCAGITQDRKDIDAFRDMALRSLDLPSATGTTDKFTFAHNALNLVDSLLAEAGYAQDSSARHNLAIAKSCFRGAENMLYTERQVIDPLPATVQECIDQYARYYAEHHNLGMSVRDDVRYVASVAIRSAAQAETPLYAPEVKP